MKPMVSLGGEAIRCASQLATAMKSEGFCEVIQQSFHYKQKA